MTVRGSVCLFVHPDDEDIVIHPMALECVDIGNCCDVGHQGECYPGLIFVKNLCQLKENDQNAHMAASLLMSSSLTSNTTNDGHSSSFWSWLVFLVP